jgi:hypothetical protein
MKEIANTSNTALKDQSKITVNKLKSLIDTLKLCEPITGDLLIRIIGKTLNNANTVSR